MRLSSRALIAAVSTIAFAQNALAADMQAPIYKAPVVAPVYSWTGCYLGANAGHAWARTGIVETSVNGSQITFDRGVQTDSGWAFGGQIGCDYQFDRNWVAGVRGMWDGSDIKGSRDVPPGDFIAGADHVRIDSFATLVGKLGFLPSSTVQLYVLGGVAWVHDRFSGTDPSLGEVFSAKQTRTGYDVGAGLSWMFARNWDFWVEYDHIGLGTNNVIFNGVGANSGVQLGVNVTQHVNKILVGIDYRFGRN